MSTPFRRQEYGRAARWKATTSTLPGAARAKARYHAPVGGQNAYTFCLPVEYAHLNLLPEVRDRALELFEELGIPWHASTPAGPSNHLLDSQVQCVNALGQMVDDSERLVRAFGPVVGIAEVLSIEDGRFLTFEFIGPDDHFGEGKGTPRTRGANCTSVDAAFLHRATDGVRELVLIEWKYTESYRPRKPNAASDATRYARYWPSLSDPLGPVRSDALPFKALLQEPFYQLMRQQLFAWRCEQAHTLGADRVRILHVVPDGNGAYEQSITDDHRALGDTVSEVWDHLLTSTARYQRIDSAIFLDPAITSTEYVSRYGPPAEHAVPKAGKQPMVTKPTMSALVDRLTSDADTETGSIRHDTDKALSIGSDVARLTWRRSVACAVASDADLATTCGAVLDAVAIWHSTTSTSMTVHVLIDRPLPERGGGTETDQAVRSLRDAAKAPSVQLWYRESEAWVCDNSPAPVWDADDPVVTNWVTKLMLPRLTARPHALAAELVAAIDDASAGLYPSEISATNQQRWALRLDGLEVGIIDEHAAILSIGGHSTTGVGSQRATFHDVFGSYSVVVEHEPAPTSIGVERAGELLRELMRRFRGVDVRHAPVNHRNLIGVDEHAFEARLLKGLTNIEPAWSVIHDDTSVARGSQFPTLWGHTKPSRPRYLDALVHRGGVPLAIELKVATGGMGRHYRRAISQAVLYRHFILNAPGLDPWFEKAELRRRNTVGIVGLPLPHRWTAGFDTMLRLLRQTASTFGIDVVVIDALQNPDPPPSDEESESEPSSEVGYERCFELRRLVADELVRLWPGTFKLAVDAEECGGFYSTLLVGDHEHLGPDRPFVEPYVSLGASAWVFNQLGQPRWVWRGIWEHLDAGGDVIDAARTIGIMTGLGPPAGESSAG